MNLTFHWFNIIVLFGAFNALIFSIILLFQRRHPGSKFFAAFIFVIAYNGFETFNWSSGLDQHYIFFDAFSFIVIYAIGPSVYLYISSLLFPDQKFTTGKVVAHYGFVIFQFVVRIGILVYHLLWINKIIDTKIHSMQLMNIVWFYAEPLSVIIFLAYLAASIHQFRKYKKTLPLKVTSKQTIWRWVNSLLLCLRALGIAWVLTVVAPYVLDIPFDVHYYPIEIGLALFTYWIVLNGYHKVKLISNNSPNSSNNTVVHDHYEKLFERLRTAMEMEKIYLDPDLSLAKMSSHTGIPAKTISAILNQHQKTSFNDFVNGYRIKEVSERMMDPANQHFTISGIALESGFNTQATFQRVFKNSMGMSPREYMSRHLKKTA
jgi:AraC-like DNA-binding protein